MTRYMLTEAQMVRAMRLAVQARISEANRLVRRGEPTAPRNAARIEAALAKRARKAQRRIVVCL